MALPLLAQFVIGLAAPKVIGAIGQKNNWDPKFTSLLSLGAGFGAGAAGAGAFSGASGSLASMATPAASAGLGSAAGGFSGAVGGGGMGAAAITSPMASVGTPSWAPYAFRSAAAPRNVMGTSDPGVMTGLINKGYDVHGASTWDKLKAYGKTTDGQSFLKAASGTLVDGLFAQRPPVRSSRGGGGGGGGGPRAPAYPGGGGAGQKQVVWGFGQGGFNPQQVA